MQQVGLVDRRTAGRRGAAVATAARVDLQFGQATETVQGSAANEPRPDVYRHIWQAYGSYVLPGRPARTAGGRREVRLEPRLRNQLREGQPGILARPICSTFCRSITSGVRLTFPVHSTDHRAVHADQRHPADGGLQRLQVAPGRACPAHRLSPVTWTVNYYTGREQPDDGQPDGPDGPLHRGRYLRQRSRRRPRSASASTSTTRPISGFRPIRAGVVHRGLALYGRYQLAAPFAWRLQLRASWLTKASSRGIEQTLHEVTRDGGVPRSPMDCSCARSTGATRSSDLFFPGPSRQRRSSSRTADRTVGAIWVLGTRKGTW